VREDCAALISAVVGEKKESGRDADVEGCEEPDEAEGLYSLKSPSVVAEVDVAAKSAGIVWLAGSAGSVELEESLLGSSNTTDTDADDTAPSLEGGTFILNCG